MSDFNHMVSERKPELVNAIELSYSNHQDGEERPGTKPFYDFVTEEMGDEEDEYDNFPADWSEKMAQQIRWHTPQEPMPMHAETSLKKYLAEYPLTALPGPKVTDLADIQIGVDYAVIMYDNNIVDIPVLFCKLIVKAVDRKDGSVIVDVVAKGQTGYDFFGDDYRHAMCERVKKGSEGVLYLDDGKLKLDSEGASSDVAIYVASGSVALRQQRHRAVNSLLEARPSSSALPRPNVPGIPEALGWKIKDYIGGRRTKKAKKAQRTKKTRRRLKRKRKHQKLRTRRRRKTKLK